MPRPATMKFGLADLMILIGATAFGLGGYILLDNALFGGKRYFFGLFRPPSGGWNSALIIERAGGALASMLVLFGGWTMAVPIIGMRKPRPIRRRIARQPGLAACAAVLIGMATAGGVAGLSFFLRWAIDGVIRLPTNFWNRGLLFDNVIVFAGVSVAATWTIQVATGRWRPKPDAFDRIGRFLGVLWLVAGLVFATRQLLQ